MPPIPNLHFSGALRITYARKAPFTAQAAVIARLMTTNSQSTVMVVKSADNSFQSKCISEFIFG